LGLAAAAALVRPASGGSGGGVVAAASLEGKSLDRTSDLEGELDTALAAVTNLSPREAWRSLFRAEDRVAIKLNCLAAPHLSPHRALVEALARRIESAGVEPGAIVLFDRTSRELERAGFPSQRAEGEVRCFGTDALKGGGYGDKILEYRSIGSFFTRILTDHATVLVNVGVCKDHDLAGVSAGLKNLYGLIHNPNRYHANRCDPFVADLADHPAVRPKLRLTVIDAITAQFHGGPAYNAAYTFRPNRILVSLDPIAVERIAWEMIEAERSRRGMPTLEAEKRSPTWIATASKLGLGESERERIVVREVNG